MCATVFAPQVTMTKPFVAMARYQDSSLRRVEHAGDREQPLGRKWLAAPGRISGRLKFPTTWS